MFIFEGVEVLGRFDLRVWQWSGRPGKPVRCICLALKSPGGLYRMAPNANQAALSLYNLRATRIATVWFRSKNNAVYTF